MKLLISSYYAHAFGQDFSLPLPVWMFVFGGAAVVILSFVLVSIIPETKTATTHTRRYVTNSYLLINFGRIAKTVGLFIFLFAIITGLFGSPVNGRNFNVIFYWVIFLVGFTYMTAIFGNLWKVSNPYLTIIELIERKSPNFFKGMKRYPKIFGYYPALFIYFAVICLELLTDSLGTLPQSLSGLLILYLILTVMGCIIYGKYAWFRYCDFYSVFFGLISKLSPFAYRNQRLVLRPPFVGLLEVRPKDTSLVLFILFMLASTSYDGFNETKQYVQIRQLLPIDLPEGLYGLTLLFGITGLLYALYRLSMAVMKRIAQIQLTPRELCLAFATTLIPIAVGYNIAHYVSYLLTTGQAIVREISDPFDKGWNLLGTADYQINPTPLNPYATWYIQVGAIVLGHVVAVYLAHKVALKLYKRRSVAVRSQLPVIAVMLIYTTISLWIIAQPIYVSIEQSKIQKQEARDKIEGLRPPPKPNVP